MGAPSAHIAALHDPLPQRLVLGDGVVGGRIKERPEDFLVDEQPLYEPCGEGEHLYIGVEKRRVSHGELIATLARHFGVRRGAIGFAGMKDKQGITRQAISVHLLDPPPSLEVAHDRIRILWAMRHRNKLRRGHLAGNRFSIRIRDLDALAAPRVLRIMRRLEQVGVPCGFGPQRFGYRCNNHLVGAMLLRGEHQAAIDELLGSRGTPFPEHQRERRELYDRGLHAEAAALWPTADRTELIVARALRDGRSPFEACRAVGATTYSFWLSAFQSAIFNRVLDQRIEQGLLGSLVEGDLAWRHDRRCTFAISADDAADPEIHRRLAALEISPTGPLWGAKTQEPGSAILAAEEAALQTTGVDRRQLESSRDVPRGARRPLRGPIRGIEVDSGIDEHGHYVRVAFDLPRGMYATVAMREVTGKWGAEEDGE